MPSPHKRDARIEAALEELRGTIKRRYPDATFEVAFDLEECGDIDLITTVDLDDPFDVHDLVVDRLIQIQVDEGIPLHVLPMRTAERVLADRPAKQDAGQRARPTRPTTADPSR